MAFLGGPVLSRKINVTGNAHAAKTEAVAGARCGQAPLARGPRRGAGVGGSGASPARLGPRPERLMRGALGPGSARRPVPFPPPASGSCAVGSSRASAGSPGWRRGEAPRRAGP